MKKIIKILIPVALLLIIFLAMGPFYILNEGEQAVITRFGKIEDRQNEAGLKLKVPLIDSVTKYSKKILSWDGDPQEFQTAENQFIWVDTTARWKISDPIKFYESVKTMNQAYGKLDAVIESAVKNIVAKNYLIESVRNSNTIIELQKEAEAAIAEAEKQAEENAVEGADSTTLSLILKSDTVFEEIVNGRSELSDEMLNNAALDTVDLGIELIDVVIRQIRYTDAMTQSVYDRMIKERNQIAQYYRSYGQGKKSEWAGKTENEKEVLISEAYSKSEKIKGDAEAEALAIEIEAYGKDLEFYEFWKAVESYKKTLPGMSKTLSTDMQYFNNFYKSE